MYIILSNVIQQNCVLEFEHVDYLENKLNL